MEPVLTQQRGPAPSWTLAVHPPGPAPPCLVWAGEAVPGAITDPGAAIAAAGRAGRANVALGGGRLPALAAGEASRQPGARGEAPAAGFRGRVAPSKRRRCHAESREGRAGPCRNMGMGFVPPHGYLGEVGGLVGPCVPWAVGPGCFSSPLPVLLPCSLGSKSLVFKCKWVFVWPVVQGSGGPW